MDNQPARTFAFVLCQLIFFFGTLGITPANAQQPDTMKGHVASSADSIEKTAFHPTNTTVLPTRPARSIDVALTGGAGSYNNGTITAFQPTANADFFAQTSLLDLTAGLHWGFSNPSTKAFSLGVRLPISESEDGTSGFFADASLLLIDNGTYTDSTSDAFSTGLRAALAARAGPFECRIAGEVRTFPFGGNTFEGWAGIEAGFVINLLREESLEPTPKDSLKAELHYIATSAEMDALDEATSQEEIDAWLDRFWQTRNMTGTHQNEVREEYMRRVRMANEKFGTPGEMGVKTDQGRVMLLYGVPDHTERAPSTVYGSDRRYELWVDENRVQGYQVALFLFVSTGMIRSNRDELNDMQVSTAQGTNGGHGEFREMYSNVPGEPSEAQANMLPADLPASMQSYISAFR